MNYFDKEGHLTDSGISLYSDAIKLRKVDHLPLEIKTHVDSCSKCQHEVVDFSALMLDVDQGKIMEHPTLNTVKKEALPKNQGGLRMIYKLAIAAVIAGLLFFGYQQFSQNSQPRIVETPEKTPSTIETPQDQNIAPKDEENIATNEEKPTEEIINPPVKQERPREEIKPEIDEDNRVLYAANFVENEELESMVGTVFRSEEFTIISPVNERSYKEKDLIQFEWEDKVSLKLTILDNTEEERFVKDLEKNRFATLFDFDPGIYYWKLETADELLHLGKFIIE